MKVIIDENVVRQIAEGLRQDGHEVQRIKDIARGSLDPVVLTLANQDGSLLLTGDKDFGELLSSASANPGRYPGSAGWPTT